MSIIDVLAAFCFKFSITGAGPVYSTSDTSAGTKGAGYIDLGASDQFAKSTNTGTEYIGVGEPIMIEALITTKLDDANTPRLGTVVITVETADDAAFTSNLTTLMTLGTFAAGAAAGTALIGRLPVGSVYRRYLRVKATNGTTLTAGKLSAFLLHDAPGGQNYPSRITVS
jgi:hypothetical protein